MTQMTSVSDQDTQSALHKLEDRTRIEKNKVAGVHTVLVVLSSTAMVMDLDALRHVIALAYPEAAVFFQTTSGRAHGVPAPKRVDLLIDFTGPRQRQGWFYARKLRRMAKLAVGRNAGLFRKSIYDRVYDEKAPGVPVLLDGFSRERRAQREVLNLAGVPFLAMGGLTPDRSKHIALELPPFARR